MTNARLTLLAPTPPDISAFGIRSLSAFLKHRGHDVRTVFLPGGIGRYRHGRGYVYRYQQRLLDEVLELCRGSTLVGVSLMTNYVDRAIQLTRAVQERLGLPLVWGGIHPTVRPQQALEHADFVCIGEGEEALAELLESLARGERAPQIPGIVGRGAGAEPGAGRPRPLIADLDRLPFFDFDLDGHYVYDRISNHIRPMTAELLRRTLPRMPYFGGRSLVVYRTMASRGCPHRCAYCANATLWGLHAGEPYFRKRSTDHVMAELEQVRSRYPFVEGVQFFDDTLLGMRLEEIEQFAEQYRQRVQLPFYCQCSPTTLTEGKLDLLLEAGMVFLEMGIQTGSDRVARQYHRAASRERIVAGAALIRKRRGRLLKPHYHVILDNPWESTEDRLQTLELLLEIPRPYKLCLSSLTFYPGTALQQQALAEGKAEEEDLELSRRPFYKPQATYCNLLIRLCDAPLVPVGLLRLLSRQPLFGLMETRPLALPVRLLTALESTSRLAFRGARALLLRGEFARLRTIFREL